MHNSHDSSPCRKCPERHPDIYPRKHGKDIHSCEATCELLDHWRSTTQPSIRPAIDTADQQGYAFLF